MPPQSAPTPTRRAISPLDHHLQAATGHDIDTLWAYRDRGVLDRQHALLVDRHRDLVETQTSVAFYLRLLNRLTSGEFDVDGALFTRIERTVDQLEEAAAGRDAAAREVLAALEPIEAAAASTEPDAEPLSTDDQAALLAIAGGAKLYEHLLTGRMSSQPPPAPASPTPSCGGWKTPAWSPWTPATPSTPASRYRSPTPDEPRCSPSAAPPRRRRRRSQLPPVRRRQLRRSGAEPHRKALVASHRTDVGPEAHSPGRL
ncbi:hypothetical protein [Streptomyces sp. NPDC001833]|uniref:hypothetical protein n=1 Tax=Streptomyces sp. NPDC001833 TaxID=3154658 RepID=UPI00332C4111